MAKKIYVFLSMILVLFTVFFAQLKPVNADDTTFCEWLSPLSFVDSNGILSKIQIQIPASVNRSNGSGSAVKDFFAQWTGDLYSISGTYTQSLSGFTAKLDRSERLYFGLGKSYYHIDINTYFDDKIDYETEGISMSDGCADYIKVKCDPSEEECIVYPSSAEEYKDYLSNVQFSFSDSSTERKIYNLYTILVEDEDEVPESYYSYLSVPTVYRLKGYPSRYPKENLKKFEDYSRLFLEDDYESVEKTILKTETTQLELEEYKKNNPEVDNAEAVIIVAQDVMKKVLGEFIDVGTVNNRTFDNVYYEATRDRMFEVYKNENGKFTDEKKEIFCRWFYYAGRYVFEDDVAVFRDMVQYIYENGEFEAVDDELYNNMIAIIDSFNVAKTAEVKIEVLKQDNCTALCLNCIKTSSTYNELACTACKNGSSYKKCHDCYNSTCSYDNSTARESCLNSCLGDSIQTTIKKEIENVQTEFDDAIQRMGRIALETYIVKLADPDTLNVHFNGKYYPVCEDWENFHIVYRVMIILAPILTVILGSLDFIKAIATSDAEKMKK